jgi:hypothetical protein
LPLLKKVIMDRFGDEVAITASSDGNGGKLVYSKYNSQFQAEPCRTDEQRSKVADEIEAMLDADNGAGDCV